MKKVFIIVFLALFIFFTGGYYFVFMVLQHHSDKKLANQFDADDYAREATITIKIPISLPYPVYANGFERVNGEFEYKGEFYKLVKHKLEGDTLHVVCFKDLRAKRISIALSDFAKLSNDIPLSSKSPISIIAKIIKDYESVHQPEIIHNSTGWSLSTTFHSSEFSILQLALPVFSPPPEQAV